MCVPLKRPYGDPVFKTPEALRVNAELREPGVDPLFEAVGAELISEEMLLHSLGRYVRAHMRKRACVHEFVFSHIFRSLL